jgi:hypothetical protein
MTDTPPQLLHWSEAERQLAQYLRHAPNAADLYPLVMARALLGVERLEARVQAYDERPVWKVTRRVRPEIELDGLSMPNNFDGSILKPPESEPACNCVGPFDGEHMPGCAANPPVPPRVYTAPEPLPVGATVRILEMGNDVFPHHQVGDLLKVVCENSYGHKGPSVYASHISGGDNKNDPCYMTSEKGKGSSWVRKFELVEEPARVEAEPLTREFGLYDKLDRERDKWLTECQKLYAAFKGSGHAPKNPREAAQAISGFVADMSELTRERDELKAAVATLTRQAEDGAAPLLVALETARHERDLAHQAFESARAKSAELQLHLEKALTESERRRVLAEDGQREAEAKVTMLEEYADHYKAEIARKERGK